MDRHWLSGFLRRYQRCWWQGIFYGYANVGTVVNLEIDVFEYDRIVAIANNEELGLTRQCGDLVGLTLFDKPG